MVLRRVSTRRSRDTASLATSGMGRGSTDKSGAGSRSTEYNVGRRVSVRPEFTIAVYGAESLASVSAGAQAMADVDHGSIQDDAISSAADSAAPFHHLAQRAEAFITEQGGRASEDLLISHVFGSSGSPELWRPLLRNVLGQHEGLKLRGD